VAHRPVMDGRLTHRLPLIPKGGKGWVLPGEVPEAFRTV